jgi:hypothetical protein
MELVKATSEHPNLRKGRQKQTHGSKHARTHARAHDVPQQSHARRNRAHRAKEKKKKKKRKENERRGGRKKGKNWLSNLTRVKSTTLSTRDAFHLLLSVFGQQLPNE